MYRRNTISWIQTYTGKRVDPLDMKLEDLSIYDIAHALSLICRYSGHCNHFYSVAEHSCLISDLCSDTNKLSGLLHDASEAYLVDLARPVKQGLRDRNINVFDVFEENIEKLVNKKWQVDCNNSEVKELDSRMIRTEAPVIMAGSVEGWSHMKLEPLDIKIELWSPLQAETEFLKRFYTFSLGGG